MNNGKILEEEYREAYEIWKNEHPGQNANDIERDAIIPISNGKQIEIGARIE